MNKKISGGALAGGRGIYERVEDDFYATDPNSVLSFLNEYELDGKIVYEPCVGEGHIAKTIKNYYLDKMVYGTDLVDRGYGDGVFDFINGDVSDLIKLGVPVNNVDWVITNPPFKFAKEFINKSLNIANKGVVMFLKIQFLESQSRKEWFKETPLKYVYVFSKRQVVLNNGQKINPKTGKAWASTMCFCWYIWEKD